MAQRKSRKPRSANKRGRSQSQKRSAGHGTSRGELPFIRQALDGAEKGANAMEDYLAVRDYTELLNDATALARRNVAATFSLGIAAGLFTAQLARRWSTGNRER